MIVLDEVHFRCEDQKSRTVADQFEWNFEGVESTLKLCNVIFSTSGLDLKTGNWNFPENPAMITCNIFLEISDIPETESFPIWF